MISYLVQVKCNAGMYQIEVVRETGAEDEKEIEKAAVEAVLNYCRDKGIVCGLGIMQVLFEGDPIMGSHFIHYGGQCLQFLNPTEFTIRSIIDTGAIMIDRNEESIPLQEFVDLQSILSYCSAGNHIGYQQRVYKMSLYDALMSIHTEGELKLKDTLVNLDTAKEMNAF